MKVAVVTPTYRTPATWLQQCLDSVAAQTVPCTHFLVCDGDAPIGLELGATVEVLRTPRPHEDCGNVARAIGSVSAISRGFDAIAYLDADNWYAPAHVAHLVELQQRTGAVVLSTARLLHHLDGDLLGPCPEVDGESFVDTSCLCLLRPAFNLVSSWYLMPKEQAVVCDRVIWRAVLEGRWARAHHPEPTVHFRTRYLAHYRHFGQEPPPGAKHVVVRSAPATATPPAQIFTVGAGAATLPVPDRIQHPTVAPPPSPNRQRVSLCLIVRDEEANLADCLRPVAPLVDEIIVVDTGSTDRTRELAQELGARVFDFAWCDDFSAARNECLRHATGEWIFWLDADERLDVENCQRLERLFAQLPEQNCVYMMKQWSLPTHNTGAGLVVEQARLFRRQAGAQWRYRLHEQILPALNESGAQVLFTQVVIQHLGYQSPALRQQKLQRNLRVLHQEEAERPQDAFTLFNLGGTYLDVGEAKRALPYLQRSLELAPAGASFVVKLYVLLARALRSLGQVEEALRYCQQGQQQYPHEVELWFEAGLLHERRKDAREAARCFAQVLLVPTTPRWVGSDPALRGHLGRHHLALAHRALGQPAEAEAQWRQAVAAAPGFGPGWLGLTELYLAQRRGQDIAGLVQQLLQQPETAALAAVVQGRVLLAQQKIGAARELLEKAAAQAPESLWLRLLLSEVLMREGKDRSLVEQSR